MDVRQMLEEWDEGKLVATLEMGGFGPGYEQALQIAAIEFCRLRILFPNAKPGSQDDFDKWHGICREGLERFHAGLGQLTDPQINVAVKLSWWWCFDPGYEQTLARWERDPKLRDRMIMVRRFSPQAPPPPR